MKRKSKKLPEFPIHSRQSLREWYHYTFDFDKAAGVIQAYVQERDEQDRGGKLYVFHLDMSQMIIKENFWWFVRFVSSCNGTADTVIREIASKGRPYHGHDYALMREWAVTMGDLPSWGMRDFCLMKLEDVQKACVPFIMAAKVLVRMKLVAEK